MSGRLIINNLSAFPASLRESSMFLEISPAVRQFSLEWNSNLPQKNIKAINLFAGPEQFKDIKVVSYNYLYQKADGVIISGIWPRYTVQLLNPKTFFMNGNDPLESTFNTRHFEILNFARDRYDLRFKKNNSRDKLVFYSAGRMESLCQAWSR